jgi:hypothetical protein
VRGTRVPEHWLLQLEPREGASLRRVLADVRTDEELVLNDLEDETVAAIIEVLESEDA